MKFRQIFESADYEQISKQNRSEVSHREIGICPLPKFYPKKVFEFNDKLMGADISREPKIKEWLLTSQPDMEHVDVKWLMSKPGTIVTSHWDTDAHWRENYLPKEIDPDVEDVIRRIIFVTDWEQGQDWSFEDKIYTGWKRGTCVEWAWWAKHGTKNTSDKIRVLIKLTGVRKNIN